MTAEATSLGIDQEKSTARTGTQAARVLPADVYDTLEFSALVYGGVGAGWLTEEQRKQNTLFTDISGTPFCAFGHAGFVSAMVSGDFWDNPVGLALARAFGTTSDAVFENNIAVRAINRRRGKADEDARVSFKGWCAELNIVRGDS